MAKQYDKIIILLAVYNGATYLREQLDSLLEQEHQKWEALIRDDGSTDKSLEIIRNYEKRDERFKLIDEPADKHGACANFGALYKWAKANRELNYLMFCDQDDIWKPNKVSETLRLTKERERTYNRGIMLYGSLELIDEQGNKLPGEIRLADQLSFHATLAQNYAFGCTMMLNKALIDLITEIPDWAENHDYWVCLVATAFGATAYQPKKLILYRQHSANVTSQGNSLAKRWHRFGRGFDEQLQTMKKRIVMLQGFHDQYGARLAAADKEILKAYLKSIDSFGLNRIVTAIRYDILKSGLLQNAGFFYTLLRLGKQKGERL